MGQGEKMKQGKGILCAVCLVILGCTGEDGGLAVDSQGRTVVERYGQLRVEGTTLLNAAGKPVQLRGISSFGLQYAGQYANEEVLRWLRDDRNMQIWRAALYTREGGYIRQPALKSKVVDSVEAAIGLGIYVLVDWHILPDQDPRLYQKQAIAFFGEMTLSSPHIRRQSGVAMILSGILL
jgi:endoglucanase